MVDLDISKGLFESINLVLEEKRYLWFFHYVNISFHCFRCHLYGHVMKDFSKSFFKKKWRKKDFQRAIYEEKKPLVPKEIVDQKSFTEVAPAIYSHEKVGKGFGREYQNPCWGSLNTFIVGARPILGYKVGFKGVEGLALEHRSSSHIQEASKENVNTCENDVVKLNLFLFLFFSFQQSIGGCRRARPCSFYLD